MSTKTNGVATPNQSATANSKADTKTTAPVVAIENKSKSDVPPLDDRLLRLGQLFDLHKKFTVLQNTLQKLKEFEFKKDDETCSLTIRDDRRIEFTTYHNGIIEEVVEFVKERIQHRVKELEPKLNW